MAHVSCACTQVFSIILSSSSPTATVVCIVSMAGSLIGGHHNVKYNVNVPLFTYWLHGVEFKELDELAQEARLHGMFADEVDLWNTALDAILWCASDHSTEEDLTEALSWALIDKTA